MKCSTKIENLIEALEEKLAAAKLLRKLSQEAEQPAWWFDLWECSRRDPQELVVVARQLQTLEAVTRVTDFLEINGRLNVEQCPIIVPSGMRIEGVVFGSSDVKSVRSAR